MPNSNLGSINLNGILPDPEQKQIITYLEFLPQTTDQITCPFCLDRYNGKVMGEDLSLDKCPVCKGKRVVTGKLARQQWGQFIKADFELNAMGDNTSINNTYKTLNDVPKEFLNTADENTIQRYKNKLSNYCKCYIYIQPYTTKSVKTTQSSGAKIYRNYLIAPSNEPIKKIQLQPLSDITNKDIYDIDLQDTISMSYNFCWGEGMLNNYKMSYQIVEGSVV